MHVNKVKEFNTGLFRLMGSDFNGVIFYAGQIIKD